MDQVELQHSQAARFMSLHKLALAVDNHAPTLDPDLLLKQIEESPDPQIRLPLAQWPEEQLVPVVLADRDDCLTLEELEAKAYAFGLKPTLRLSLGSGYATLLYRGKPPSRKPHPSGVGWLDSEIYLEDFGRVSIGFDSLPGPGTCINGNAAYVQFNDVPVSAVAETIFTQRKETETNPDSLFPPTRSQSNLPKIQYQHIRDVAPDLDRDPVIKGVLERDTVAGLIGQPNEGKTFVAVSMGFAVAAGREWLGRKVAQGAAAIVSVEAPGSAKKRIAALRKAHGIAARDVPLFLFQGAIRLGGDNNAGARELIDGLKAAVLEAGQPLQVVFIDNLAAAMVGGDENASKDMSRLLDDLDSIRAATGACVVLIHHQGKDASKGARGHSSFRAKLDTELTVADGTVKVTKQRDDAYGPPIGFRLTPIEIGRTISGEPVTTCIVEPRNIAAEEAFAPKPLPDNAQGALRILQDITMSGRKAPVEEWRDAFISQRYAANRKTGATQFKRALRVLATSGRVAIDGGKCAAVD